MKALNKELHVQVESARLLVLDGAVRRVGSAEDAALRFRAAAKEILTAWAVVSLRVAVGTVRARANSEEMAQRKSTEYAEAVSAREWISSQELPPFLVLHEEPVDVDL